MQNQSIDRPTTDRPTGRRQQQRCLIGQQRSQMNTRRQVVHTKHCGCRQTPARSAGAGAGAGITISNAQRRQPAKDGVRAGQGCDEIVAARATVATVAARMNQHVVFYSENEFMQ